MALMEKARLAATVYSLLMFSFVFNVVQIIARPLDYIGLRSFRQKITGAYHNSVGTSFVFWLEYVAGVKIVITGDLIPKNERVLLICNHVRVEWLHLICLAYHLATAGAFKTIMKDALKYVPIAWAAVLEGHITVKRGGGKDVRVKTIQSTKSQAAQLCKDGNPLWLVLFPEGTWLKPGENEVKDKANAFAVKEGYAEFENVLFPRAGAFLALLDECRQEAHCLDALYDVTVAYSKPYHPVKIGTANPPSVLLLSGGGPDAPKEVHFHVKRFPLPAGMPEGEEGVTKWLFDNYVEKEALLNKFEAANPHTFPGPERSTPLDLTNLVLHQLFLLASLLALLVCALG